MYWLVKNRKLLTIAATIAMGLTLGSQVLATSASPTPSSSEGTFGLKKFEQGASGLGNKDVRETIAQLINVALTLLGVVAVVIVLMGGFKWMTAGGNDDQIGEARKLIFAGIIGMAIILSAFAISRFVLEKLSQATGTGDYQNL